MADVLKQLLQEYDSALKTARGLGGTLTQVKSQFLIQAPNQAPQDFSIQTPTILFYPEPVDSVPISIPAIMHEKTYRITFLAVVEQTGRSDKGLTDDDQICDILDALENLFIIETFNLTEWANVVAKDYTNSVQLPFSGQHTSSGSITFEHKHTDVRQCEP